jgi:two-component system response regulator AtoC
MQQHSLDGQPGFPLLPPEDVIFGHSPHMALARAKLLLATDSKIPVLLQGDSGTGKEVLAQLLHRRSQRSRFPWIKVTCPAIPDSLVESELFGYEKGAFSGAYSTKRGRVELAHRGTLFLDELSSLELSVQAKLLQLLQDGTFMRVGGQDTRSIDARIVSSANVDLKRRVADGSFRADLLYRLNAVTIDLPPLRQRIGDLPILVDYFLSIHSRSMGRYPRPLSSRIMHLMRRYSWPGNIRQLENLMRSYVLIENEDVVAADLVPNLREQPSFEIDLEHPVSLKEITKTATERLEREIIFKVLQANRGSRRKTAQWLNISYRSLLYKLDEAQTAGYPVPHRTLVP